MPQKIVKGYKALLEEANTRIQTLSLAQAQQEYARGEALFVDLRDPREMAREGKIPGAFSCPRGMLEFWIDPESPYAKDVFQQDRPFVFFCGGGWRSALAADIAQQMGLRPVSHMEGGFSAWKNAGAPVEEGAAPPVAAPSVSAGASLATSSLANDSPMSPSHGGSKT